MVMMSTLSKEVIDSTNQFCLDLLKVVLKDNSENAVFSPVSVYTLLAILQQGAVGMTRTEVDNVVHAQPEETRINYKKLTARYQGSFPRVDLEFSTRAFAASKYEFKSDFKQKLADDFQSGIDNVNLTNPDNATTIINDWVSQSTHQKINELFQSTDLTHDAALVLVNALYFQSHWDNPFSSTENKTFSPSTGEDIQVPTLCQTKVYHAGECSRIGMKYVHLDFVGNEEFSVMMVLPTKRHDLNTLVEHVTAENLTNIINHIGPKRVTLQFPKFRLNSKSCLTHLLHKLGINKVFHDDAELSGMTSQPIKLSKVLQKAEIQADENGVTAAAATGATYYPLWDLDNPNARKMDFIADQPFLFFIVDRINHVPLFAGRVSNPSVR